ncbi:Os12g0586500, partial [Oryza sativa Japonica Group]
HHTHTHTHQLPPTPDRSAGWIRKTLATSAARSQIPERASEREWKRRRRRRRREYVVGVLDGLGLAALVEVGGEAEAALGVLDDAAELAPPPERLLRRVLRLHPAEILLQVAARSSWLVAAAAAAAASSLPPGGVAAPARG